MNRGEYSLAAEMGEVGLCRDAFLYSGPAEWESTQKIQCYRNKSEQQDE